MFTLVWKRFQESVTWRQLWEKRTTAITTPPITFSGYQVDMTKGAITWPVLRERNGVHICYHDVDGMGRGWVLEVTSEGDLVLQTAEDRTFRLDARRFLYRRCCHRFRRWLQTDRTDGTFRSWDWHWELVVYCAYCHGLKRLAISQFCY